MEILAIVAVVVLAAIAVYFFFENGGLHKRVVSLDEQLREAQSQKPARASSTKSEEKKSEAAVKTVATADPEVERELDEARSEIKDLKKQIYDLKKGSKDLKQKVQDATEERGSELMDSDMLFELREEIAELKAENLRLDEAVKAAKKAPRAEAPAPRKEEPAPAPAPVAAPTGDADYDALRAKYEKEAEQMRLEVRDLDRKLKSTASNVDKQRRRADNNDRAYKITQRQYDAAQERVELLEAQLKKAGFAAPAAPEAPEAPAAEKKAAAAPAPKAAPAPAPAPVVVAPPAAPVPAEKPEPKPDTGSTTVLSSKALASVSSVGSDDETDGGTIQNAKAVTAADIAAAVAAPEPQADKDEELSAFESGGHTAMLTPGALAASVKVPDEKTEEPEAYESGGHTAVMSSASLSKAVSREAVSTDSEDEADPRETAERTAILSPGAFARSEDAADEEPEVVQAAEPAAEVEGGRRPSSGLFGMPDDVLNAPREEEDPVRTTQFAFPTQSIDSDAGGPSKFGGLLNPSARLGGSANASESPAEPPVPDAEEKSDAENRLGSGRLGDIDLGDIGSAIDDAWGDLDVD